MKQLVREKPVGLYINGFDLFGNVYESGLRKAVKKANIERIMRRFVSCGDILEKDVAPENFYNNFEAWNILSNYVTTQPITIEEVWLTLTKSKRKILVVQFGKYESEDDYFYEDEEQ